MCISGVRAAFIFDFRRASRLVTGALAASTIGSSAAIVAGLSVEFDHPFPCCQPNAKSLLSLRGRRATKRRLRRRQDSRNKSFRKTSNEAPHH